MSIPGRIFKAIGRGVLKVGKGIGSGTKKSFGWAKGQADKARERSAARREEAAQRRASSEAAPADAGTAQGDDVMARRTILQTAVARVGERKNLDELRKDRRNLRRTTRLSRVNAVWDARKQAWITRTEAVNQKAKAAAARKTYKPSIATAKLNARTTLVQARDTNRIARENSRNLGLQIKEARFNQKVARGTEGFRQRGLNQGMIVQKLQDRLDVLKYQIDRPRSGPFANMVRGRLQRKYNKTLIALQRMQGRSANTGRRYVRQDSRRRNLAGQQMQVAEPESQGQEE